MNKYTHIKLPGIIRLQAICPHFTRISAYGRNLLHGPGIATVNFSLFKHFPLRERARFQFRFETFNLLNHANLSNPSATFGTSSFGNITGLSTNARNIQIAAKLLF